MKRLSILLALLLSLQVFAYGQLKDTLLIDLGGSSNTSPLPWNNLTNVTSGHIPNLVNSWGFPTGMSIRVVDRFNSTSAYGTSSPSPTILLPASATIDYFFGNTVEFSGLTLPTASVILEGLDPAQSYTLEIFASRLHSNNLHTKYTLQGATTDSLFLDVHTNTGTVVSSTLQPNTNGEILITALPGPNNNNAYGFYYLGAIRLIYNHIPFPNPPSLHLVSPNGGEYWQAGKQPFIRWESESLHSMVLEYSIDQGATWQLIDSVKHYQEPYTWAIPPVNSKKCLVRITADTLTRTSAATFEIATDTITCPVVVLGSSTAAGAGASPSDSSWVNRLRYNLFQKNTRFTVTNLAKGGYTTYHILPTGTYIPPEITKEIDTLRNITKALSFHPYAVIVNMPSNDASNLFSSTQQLANYKLIQQTALAHNAITWICTPQPRNFSNPVQIQIQRDVTDSLLSVFHPYTIDFWNGLADNQGHIPPIYDSGDGVHLNNAGHLELFRRVWQHTIDTPGCSPYIGISENITKPSLATAFPNPFDEYLTIETTTLKSGTIELQLFDIQGKMIQSTRTAIGFPGKHQFHWKLETRHLPTRGLVCLVINFYDQEGKSSRQLIKLIARKSQ